MCAEDERLSFLYMPLITFMDQLTSHSLRELGWYRARLPLKQWATPGRSAGFQVLLTELEATLFNYLIENRKWSRFNVPSGLCNR